MPSPKIRSVLATADYCLLIEFANCQKKKYDLSPLLARDMFAPLKNLAFFRAVKVEPGGHAVSWNAEIDISEHELWSRGESVL